MGYPVSPRLRTSCVCFSGRQSKLLSSSNVIVLITEDLSNIHRQITDSPSVAAIRIGLPSADERCEFVRVEPTDDVALCRGHE